MKYTWIKRGNSWKYEEDRIIIMDWFELPPNPSGVGLLSERPKTHWWFIDWKKFFHSQVLTDLVKTVKARQRYTLVSMWSSRTTNHSMKNTPLEIIQYIGEMI